MTLRSTYGISIAKIAKQLSEQGCNRTDNRQVKNQNRLVNSLAISTSLAAIVVALILLLIDTPILEVLVIFCIAPLMTVPVIINSAGLHEQAKKTYLIIATLIILTACSFFGQGAHFQYFFFILAGLPFIFFSNSKKPMKWHFSLLAFTAWISAEIYFEYQPPLLTLTEPIEHAFRFLSNILQFIFIALMLYFFASESEKHLGELHLKQAKLKATNDQLDAALDKAQTSTRAKSIFLANMSHEIRTPLNGIVVASELVSQSALSKEQNDLIRIVQTSSSSLLAIVNDILDLSKAEANKVELCIEVFDLHKLVLSATDALKFQVGKKDVQIKSSIAPEVNQHFKGDVQKLRQILTNLLSNAVKFCEQGHVLLKVELAAMSPQEKGLLQFSIEDTGIGISTEKLDLIFESFTQEDGSISRTYGGTGLGTTISKMLVELMGGEIKAISPNPNNNVNDSPGSIFIFKMKLDVPENTEQTQILQPQNETISDQEVDLVNLNGIQILLAEDNILNQKVALQLFTSIGCELDIASDGKEALLKAAKKNYDLIFMDQMMPIMDGLSATEELRHQGCSIPIIAMAANVLEEDRLACIKAGMNDSLSKPVMRKELILMIKKWLK